MSLAAVCVVSLITLLDGVWHCWIMFEKLSTGLHQHWLSWRPLLCIKSFFHRCISLSILPVLYTFRSTKYTYPSKVKRFFLLGYNTCHICRNTCLVKPSPPMLIQVLPFCFNTEEEEKNYTQGKVRKVGWVGMTSKMLGFRLVFQRNLTTFVVTRLIKRQI